MNSGEMFHDLWHRGTVFPWLSTPLFHELCQPTGALEQAHVDYRPRVRPVGRTECALGNESTCVCRDKRKSLRALIATSTRKNSPEGKLLREIFDEDVDE